MWPSIAYVSNPRYSQQTYHRHATLDLHPIAHKLLLTSYTAESERLC